MIARDRRMVGLAALLASAWLALQPRAALSATCNLVQPNGLALVANIPSAGIEFIFAAPPSVMLGIPVDIDAAAGTLTVRRETLPIVSVETQGGVAMLDMGGPSVSGSIDGGGNVTVPNVHFDTLFAGIPLPVDLVMSTAEQSQLLNTVEYPTVGRRLDFSTGVLTLVGTGILENAPVVEEAVVSGVKITCRLDAIPDPATLPRPATLKGLGGGAKITSSDSGDVLTLHTRLVAGRRPLDFTGESLFVTLGVPNPAADSVLVMVRAGTLHGRARLLSTRDNDGTNVKVVTGHKTNGDISAPFDGKVKIAGGAKGATLHIRVAGLDLSKLGASLPVTITLGPNEATATATVRGSGKRRTFR